MSSGSSEVIFKIPNAEYQQLLDDPAAMEERMARLCPDVYTKGLEIGTHTARGIGRYEDSDYEDRGAYMQQRESLQAEGWAALKIDGIDEWEVAVHALTYGMSAGRQKPLEKFEIQGVAV